MSTAVSWLPLVKLEFSLGAILKLHLTGLAGGVCASPGHAVDSRVITPGLVPLPNVAVNGRS